MDLRTELEGLGLDAIDRDAVLAWDQALDQADRRRVDELVDALAAGHHRPDLADGGSPFRDQDRDHRLGVGVLPTLALARVAPLVAEQHRERDIAQQVSRETLADLGQQLRKYRAVHGEPGLDTQDWLAEVYGDGFARLGRLQFRLQRGQVVAGGEPITHLAVHVPGDGSLVPDEVDESLRQASTFFEEHWPEHAPVDWFVCRSWLLDPALSWRLGRTANIADFARRWEVWQSWEADRDALYFGFDVEPTPGAPLPLDDLPADSALHRALLELWRDGEHVTACAGTLPVIDQVEPEA